jgi:solute carrier family 36 (proton-coupled amino acid transporter)
MIEPQGFRRQFIRDKLIKEGRSHQEPRTTRSFIDFLSLYGHFGGEDLEEIEEEDEETSSSDEDEDEEDRILGREEIRNTLDRGFVPNLVANERTPLIPSLSGTLTSRKHAMRTDSKFSTKSKRKSVMVVRTDAEGGVVEVVEEKKGSATVTQAVLMLLKSFIGTGVLLLGRA